jgi:hypothetical protein
MTNTDHNLPVTHHTPGPWLRDDTTIYVLEPSDGWADGKTRMRNRFTVSVQGCRHTPKEEIDANARRIVAAVNACESISTHALEQGVVAELLEALQGARRLILDMGRIIRGLDDNNEWLEFWTQDGSYLRCDRRFDAVEAPIAHATAIHQPTSERN